MLSESPTFVAVTIGTALITFVAAGCRPGSQESSTDRTSTGSVVQGQPIRNRSVAPAATTTGLATAGIVESEASAEIVENGHLRLGFEVLSSFPYRVYEYYTEGVAGRPLLKSDDKIPETVRRYNGRAVAVRGFVLPLRTRKGRVTEFLLLRDQGTCCFGPQAQINHFIRVNYSKGAEFTSGLTYQVAGRLKVGETYVQGYLTGIYHLEAERVEEAAGGAN